MSRINFLLHSPIAHRGLHDTQIPENSLPAFRKAVDGRFPIELDIRLIKTGEVIVFHDDNLKRMCGIDKDVINCTIAEIREAYLIHTREHIPLLKDVLELVDGKVPLLIELKSERPVGKLEKAFLDIIKDYKGKYAIQSFDPSTVRWFKKNAPDVPRGQIASDFKKDVKYSAIIKRFYKNLRFFPITKPDFISYDIHALPNRRVKKLRAKGIPVLGWTVSQVPDTKEALKYCDNIICKRIL